MNPCKFCNQEKPLIEAHIIPRWAYMYLYPTDEVKRKPLVIVHSKRDKISQIGLYDSQILCRDCDSFLGQYDKFGKEVLLDGAPESATDKGEIAYTIKNVDTQRLRIFLLSVLWRCSISKREELKHINLGPYEQKILNLLSKLKADGKIEAEIEDFPMIITKFGGGDFPEVVDKNIQMPMTIRFKDDGINCQVLYFPKGIKIYIKTDKRKFAEALAKFQLNGTEIVVPKMRNFQDSEEFEFMVKAVHKKL